MQHVSSAREGATLAEVQDALGEVAAKGRVTVSGVRAPDGVFVVEVKAVNPRACPLSIAVDGPGEGEFSITLGHAETWFEIWGDWPETLQDLRRHVEAAAAGKFEEWTRGRMSLGVFHFDSGDVEYRQNLLVRPRLLRRWVHRQYEAY